jgi:hypothetical protein
MMGYKNIIKRGLRLDSVLLPIGVLLGYATIMFALAI